MNPAFRIWIYALIFTLAYAIAVSIFNPDTIGLVFASFFFAAIAYVVSLIGLYLLFAALKLMRTNRWIYWTSSLLSASVIVLFNAWLMFLWFVPRFSFSIDGAVRALFTSAAIPLATTILSIFVNYKRVNNFLTPESESTF